MRRLINRGPAASSPEISVDDSARLADRLHIAFGDDFTDLKRVAVIRDTEGQVNVLLNKQDTDPLRPFHVFDGLPELLDDNGRQTERGFVRHKSFGAAIIPRAMATICCSPPDSVPAFCFSLSLSLGKS